MRHSDSIPPRNRDIVAAKSPASLVGHDHDLTVSPAGGTATGSKPIEDDGGIGRAEVIEPDAAHLMPSRHAGKLAALEPSRFPDVSTQSRPQGAEAEGCAIYLPGYYVACMKPHPRPAYHTRGWYEPEPEFTWIDGIEGTIEMIVRRPRDFYTFLIEVVPNGFATRPQTLEIFFNYFRIGYFEVLKPSSLSVELPNELFILRKTRISLCCPNAVTGAEYGVSETRRLGIAVCGWALG